GALGRKPHITIFGTDYPTPDGTCIRDYVHVTDLIDAHVTVMRALKPVSKVKRGDNAAAGDKADSADARIYNIGIGRGYSVREVIEACRRVTGVNFKEVPGARRQGDPPALYADASKIKRE